MELKSRVRDPLLPTLFFLPPSSAFRNCGRPAIAEGGEFFAQKYLRILLKIYYINYRYDRRYAEDLHPPHYWQTNSNYGSLGTVLSKYYRRQKYALLPSSPPVAKKKQVAALSSSAFIIDTRMPLFERKYPLHSSVKTAASSPFNFCCCS